MLMQTNDSDIQDARRRNFVRLKDPAPTQQGVGN
jgi:hypothetical protein